MADKSKTKGGGSGEPVTPPAQQFQMMNNPELKKAIKQHLAFVKAKAAERRRINSEISTSRNGLVDRGLNRAAVTYLEQYSKMEDKHKHNMDATVVIGREAMGDPIQFEMFGAGPAKKGGGAKRKPAEKPADDAEPAGTKDGGTGGASGEAGASVH